MKKITFWGLSLILLMLMSCKHEKVYNQIVKDETTGKDIYVGYVNVEGLKTEIFKDFYNNGLYNYEPNDSLVQALKPYLDDVTFRVIMGTWCTDTQEEIPRLLHVLYTAEYDPLNPEKFEMICVDRNKKAGNINVKKYNIEKIPTIILYKNGKEIGRIVERFTKRPEADLLDIVKQN
ncbi:MAG TPA: hypothetical protein PK028_00085 [Bacteroidales bacterium]|jgi:thiol-disulfide isomerase/thioredoxin|nr:thioredoxin family protein [Bacteroidales bacterium]MDI9573564.1 hypothetical protein [Bacteroidota bacterium]OQC61928.1 MAG: hypothetical protein BWX51_00069 [Bacteroidetes bacterium ADurb.Bin012]MBP9511198.1 thioredoxin family protein [Bacteroidales bacterium]MBP9587590.1 thioredoxin family protein [Bacteroidales bacterium]